MCGVVCKYLRDQFFEIFRGTFQGQLIATENNIQLNVFAVRMSIGPKVYIYIYILVDLDGFPTSGYSRCQTALLVTCAVNLQNHQYVDKMRGLPVSSTHYVLRVRRQYPVMKMCCSRCSDSHSVPCSTLPPEISTTGAQWHKVKTAFGVWCVVVM